MGTVPGGLTTAPHQVALPESKTEGGIRPRCPKVTRVPISSSQLLEFVRSLAAPDSKSRELAADLVTDSVSNYSSIDGRILTGVLVAAAVSESDPSALESQLNAIIQLGSLAEPEMVAGLRVLDVEKLPGELGDYVRDILED